MKQHSSIPCAIFGASGYSGVELSWLLHNHPQFSLKYAFSSGARDTAVSLAQLYPALTGQLEISVQPWHADRLAELSQQVRVVFLALPHEASAALAPQLIAAGLVVFDLSGAYRLRDAAEHERVYGFARGGELPVHIPYGLAEWTTLTGTEQLIAVPGCYPTVASLALKPVMTMLAGTPVINAVSGVSGAGRKAATHTSFCEVSLAAYGVASHRHQPEIAQTLGRDVLFVPHLGNFKRGILATIYAPLQSGVSSADIHAAYHATYAEQPLVRLRQQPPAVNDVVGTSYCDIHVVVAQQHLIVCAAIDNLLKGAAAQAVQLANQYFGLAPATGLLQRGGVV